MVAERTTLGSGRPPRLTAAAVRMLRVMYEKRRQRGDRSPWLKPLAQRYDMSVSALEHVVRRATYRWVE